ncbi:MAG: DUF2868 domain-containing protein, partial [Wenzhouxiangellaceae bacterium]
MLEPADWLLVETIRRGEESSGKFVIDDPATLAARRAAAEPAGCILARARARREGPEIQRAARRGLSGLRAIIGLIWLLGLLAGIAAAGSLPAAAGVLALSHALIVLLAIPSLLLLLWATLSLWPRQGKLAGGLPGRVAWRLTAFITTRLGREPWRAHLAASLAAWGRQHGRSLMALASHGFWAAFFFGCIGWLWLRFLGLRFDFSWESTLLAGPGLISLIEFLGLLPYWLFGITLPDQEQIRGVLHGTSPAADRALWAAWLLAVLAAWGLLPRLALVIALIIRRAFARPALDLSEPGYLRLLPVLAGGTADTGRKLGSKPPRDDDQSGPRGTGGEGKPVLVGVELGMEPDNLVDWPPRDTGCRVLGHADDRRQRHDIRRALELLEPKPSKIIARCSALRTPDRGTARWLSELAELAPVEIELAGTEELAAAGITPEIRI